MKTKKRKNGELKNRELAKVTGKWLKESYVWLVDNDCGCCHIPIGNSGTHTVSVCLGWHDCGKDEGWKVAWKIGWQTFNNAMQTDLDIDFDVPWATKEFCDRMNAKLSEDERRHGVRFVEGDVYDTEEVIKAHIRTNIYRQRFCGAPHGYRDWNALAAYVRKTARKVLAFAKEVDPHGGML